MKIGIVTQPLEANYGGILQNYALQTVLIKIGHDPITLRIGKKTLYAYLKLLLIHLIKTLIGRKTKFPESPYNYKRRQSGMEQFIKKHIITTPKRNWLDKNDLDRYNVEALIVGSDQVWRPNYNRHIEDMFLRFVEEYNIIKVAYAASFGTEEWIYTPLQTEECAKLLTSFRAVSVREESGIKMCSDYFGRKDTVWVADPTMLLDKDDYISLCENIPKSEEHFLFAYILDINESITNFIKAKAKSKKLKVKLISAQSNTKKEDTVEAWLAMFRDATCVITDSFHGTVFSLLFRKEFITIRNNERGNARFSSLISTFEIDKNFIDLNMLNHPTKETEQMDIDWELIYKQLDQFKTKSEFFLQEALK